MSTTAAIIISTLTCALHLWVLYKNGVFTGESDA